MNFKFLFIKFMLNNMQGYYNMNRIIKIFDHAIIDLRKKVQTENKGNWLSTLAINSIIVIFSAQFLFFEPLIAGMISFILAIALTYGFAVLISKWNTK